MPSALIGRDSELAAIEEYFAGSSSRALVLEGEAGIGKSTLWAAAVERARGLGFCVLTARPVEAEAEMSFAALGDLLSPTRDEIGALPAPQRRALRVALLLDDPGPRAPDIRVVGLAVLEHVRRLSEKQNVLLAIDDAHWVDPSSATALEFALRRLDDERIRT